MTITFSQSVFCNSTGQFTMKRILALVKSGDASLVESALQRGADPNAADANGYSCLHWASQAGNLPVVKLLVRSGADVNSPDHEGYRPFEVAINCGHPAVAGVLLESNLDVTKTRNGFSYVHACAAAGDSATLSLLLKNPKSHEFVRNRDEGGVGRAPIHWAAQSGDLITMELLLKAGSDVNIFDGDGFAPLHIAAGENHLRLVERLIKWGVSVNLKCPTWDGGTCLHFACNWEQTELAQRLLKLGADRCIADDHGKTPADYCRENGNQKIARLLNTTVRH